MEMGVKRFQFDRGPSSKGKNLVQHSRTMIPMFNGKWFECLTVKLEQQLVQE